MNLAALIAALQLFVSVHPTAGAACILMPANEASVTRDDFRAIARVEIRDNKVIIFRGEPISTSSPNARMPASQLLKQLTDLPEQWRKRSVVISEGLKKVDETYSIDVHSPVRNTGVLGRPEGELFLVIAELSELSPKEWLDLWKQKH